MTTTIQETIKNLEAEMLFCRTIIEALEGRVADGKMTLTDCSTDMRYTSARLGYTAMGEAVQWLRANRREG